MDMVYEISSKIISKYFLKLPPELFWQRKLKYFKCTKLLNSARDNYKQHNYRSIQTYYYCSSRFKAGVLYRILSVFKICAAPKNKFEQ